MQSLQRVQTWSMIFGVALAACSSRDVPATWPEQSAASPNAPAAPVAVVTQALDSHPPLPGQARTGWVGLDATEAPAHQHGSAGHSPAEHASPASHDTHDSHGAPQHPTEEQPRPAGEAAEDAVVYTCPMHPDVVADRPGKCPRCGMNLVKRDAPQ